MTMTTVRESAGMSIRPLTFEVTSESDPAQTYHVALPSCECKDFRYRRTHSRDPFCKHIRAAFDLAGWHLPEQTTGLTKDEAKSLLLRHGAYNVHGITTVLAHARQRIGLHVITLSEGEAKVEFSSENRSYAVELPA
jgi:hypothetical protein